jgi:nucleotide-binding universal stress UspA family protein
MGAQSINVISNIQEGDPQAEIIHYAHEIKADLVVLGHSGKGFIARWFEDSVGSKLLADLPCSLLIVTDSRHEVPLAQ